MGPSTSVPEPAGRPAINVRRTRRKQDRLIKRAEKKEARNCADAIERAECKTDKTIAHDASILLRVRTLCTQARLVDARRGERKGEGGREGGRR